MFNTRHDTHIDSFPSLCEGRNGGRSKGYDGFEFVFGSAPGGQMQ